MIVGVGPDPDGEPHCEHPAHRDDCDCGARPDHDYERRVER